ncbi:hypothetical protein [Streptomyces sp. S.PB5]|uniref:hypothetical protein n=1 Tax=Streptomyces sp. S.PB5 TaxID=3020844 RepID=UPI0025B1629A|nr:hypothetical protein [Streptomyces sp. S.PB5]MDN3029614.1 hypothetical protein [Streptomyces sp. S.PB5]
MTRHHWVCRTASRSGKVSRRLTMSSMRVCVPGQTSAAGRGGNRSERQLRRERLDQWVGYGFGLLEHMIVVGFGVGVDPAPGTRTSAPGRGRTDAGPGLYGGRAPRRRAPRQPHMSAPPKPPPRSWLTHTAIPMALVALVGAFGFALLQGLRTG